MWFGRVIVLIEELPPIVHASLANPTPRANLTSARSHSQQLQRKHRLVQRNSRVLSKASPQFSNRTSSLSATIRLQQLQNVLEGPSHVATLMLGCTLACSLRLVFFFPSPAFRPTMSTQTALAFGVRCARCTIRWSGATSFGASRVDSKNINRLIEHPRSHPPQSRLFCHPRLPPSFPPSSLLILLLAKRVGQHYILFQTLRSYAICIQLSYL